MTFTLPLAGISRVSMCDCGFRLLTWCCTHGEVLGKVDEVRCPSASESRLSGGAGGAWEETAGQRICHFSHLSSPWSFFFLSSDIFLGLGHFLSLTDRKIAYVVISL